MGTNVKRFKWNHVDLSKVKPTEIQRLDVVSLKEVCPDLEFVNESDLQLEPVSRRDSQHSEGRSRKISERRESDQKSDSSEKYIVEAESEEVNGAESIVVDKNIIAMNRKISIVDDTASKLKPPPSPAKNPPSEVLYISNLVRPFTLKALKELLERTGKIVEEKGFWTDKIKSKCIVRYEKQE